MDLTWAHWRKPAGYSTWVGAPAWASRPRARTVRSRSNRRVMLASLQSGRRRIPRDGREGHRPCGALGGAARALAGGSQDLGGAVGGAPATVRSRVVSGGGAALERAGTLTPYLVEEIVEDALAAGRAARLELTVPADTDDIGVAWLERQFIELATRGVEVTVRRNVPASPAQHSPPAA